MGDVRYKITITKLTKGIEGGKTWEKLHSKSEFDSNKDPQFGYVKSEEIVESEEKLYEQTSYGNFNLKGVIDAFNGSKKE